MKLKKLVLNKTCFLTFFVSLNVVYFLPIASKVYQPLGYLLIVWSLILLIYNIFIDQKSMRNRYSIVLNLFVFFFLITILLNFQYQLLKNIQNLIFIMISFYLVYDTHESLESRTRSMMIVHNWVIGIITVTGIIGLIQFAFNIAYLLPSGARQGLVENRLFGIYTSPNIGALFSLITIGLIFVNIYLRNITNGTKLQSKQKIAAGILILIHASCIILSVSRGAESTLYATIVVFALFSIYPLLIKKKMNSCISISLTLLITGLVVLLTFSTISFGRKALVLIPNTFDVNVDSSLGSNNIDDEGNLSVIHRPSPGNDITSGRIEVWKTYLKAYKQNPIFGLGNSIIVNDDKVSITKVDVSTYTERDFKWLLQTKGYVHNGYIQTLVSAGALGFITIMFFIILQAKDTLFSLFKNAKENSSLNSLQRLLAAMIVGFLVNDVVETRIIFNNRDVGGFFFWWFLGLLVVVNDLANKAKRSVDKKNIAFVAWTPLHLVNIVNVKSSEFKNDDSYLYVYDEFDGAKKYYELIKETGYFKNVYLVNPNEIGNSLIRNINVIINRNQFNVNTKDVIFDLMVTQGGNHFQKILYGQQLQKNSLLELHYLEDGMLTYVADNKNEIFNIKPLKAIIMNILNPYSIMNAPLPFAYTYEPKLLNKSELFGESKKLLPLDGAGRTTMFELVNVFNLVDTQDRGKYDNEIIFLDQPFKKANFEIDEVEIFEMIQNMIEKKILVKIHPRSATSNLYENIKQFKENIPWELIQLRYDFKNVLVISMSSTAPFTTVLMFDGSKNGSSVIFIIDVILNEYKEKVPDMFKRISDFAHKFATIQSNILIPQSKQELEKILKERN